MKQSKSALCVLLAGTLWGSMGLFVRKLNAVGLYALDIVQLRIAISLVLVGLYLLIFARDKLRVRLRDLWCFAGTGIVSLLLFSWCYFSGMQEASLSVMAVLLYTSPAFIVLLSVLLFRETLTRQKLLALVLTFAGCCLVSGLGSGSAVSMKVSVIVNGINFCGNALCVFVLKMGVAGVAVPTLISRAVGACIILALAARQDYQLRITPQSVTRFEGRTVKSILYIGIPSAFENSLFQLGRVLVVSMISLFGTVHISANAVANNLDAIGCIVGNAMGLAMITVIGRCIGAQDFEQTNYYTKKLLLWDYIAQGAVNVVVLLSLNRILSMYTLTPETRALAWTLVMIHNGMSIFLWPASFVLPNALRAANDVRFTMVVATASMLVWRMGLSWVLCVQIGMGAVGVWYAMVVDWICRIICFVARFVSGAWKKNAVKKAA